MAAYQWRDATKAFFETKADAQEVGVRLERIKQRKADKKIAASDVVQDAAMKSSPLHPLFEWDNTEAGNLYRESQARRVLASLVTVTVAKRGEPAREERAFVSIAQGIHTSEDNQGYLAVADVDKSRYAEMVERRAKNELRAWTVRYGGVEALQGLVEQVRELVPENELVEV